MSTHRFAVRRCAAVVAGLACAVGVRVARAVPLASAAVQDQGQPTTSSAVLSAADGINAATIARHLAVLATDSLRVRTTPSRALEAAARYVADQFQQLGLRPMGAMGDPTDSTQWFQRYPLPGQRRLSYEHSTLQLEHIVQRGPKAVLNEDGRRLIRAAAIDFATRARFVPEAGAPMIDPGGAGIFGPETGPPQAVLLTGPQTAASIGAAQLADRVVLYLPPASTDAATQQAVLTQLYAASRGVVFLGTTDSAQFAARIQASLQRPTPLVDFYLRKTATTHWSWVIELSPAALTEWLAMTGVDLAEARAATKPGTRELSTGVWIEAVPETSASPQTAPNVVGFVEGTDSALKRQYLVLSTRLDNGGDLARVGRDSSANASGRASDRSAADPVAGHGDNAAGVAALLAVAEALRRPGAQPRHPVLVVATSGGATGLWGSYYFADHARRSVADLTLDLSGQAPSDSTVVLDGGADVDFGQSPTWLLMSHPELALTLRDGGTVTTPSGGHFPFVQAGIPSLYLHDQDGADSGSGDKITTPLPGHAPVVDTAYTARVARFAFYLAEALANARQVNWTPDGRRRFATVAVPP